VSGISESSKRDWLLPLLFALIFIAVLVLTVYFTAYYCQGVPVTDKSWRIILETGTDMIIEAPLCVVESDWGGFLTVECFHEYTVTEGGAFCSRARPFIKVDITGLMLLQPE